MADQTLAQIVKAKYPGVYDDLPDAQLETQVKAKYPGAYDDLPTTKAADFKTTNETDAQGNPIVRGVSALGSGIAETWRIGNTPLVPQIADAAHAIADYLDAPKLERSQTEATVRGFFSGATQGAGDLAAGFTSPIGIAMTLAGLGPESRFLRSIPALKGLLELPAVQTAQKAVQAVGGGAFAAHGAGTVVTGQNLGDVGRGLTEVAAGSLGAVSALRPARSARTLRLTPEEAASNAFAQEQGIPLDASTATGSRALRAAEKRTANSIGGEGTAERLIGAQQTALGRVGNQLAADANAGGSAVSPVQAGQAVRQATETLINDLNQQANDAYGTLRKIEADPQHAQQVATAAKGSTAYRGILDKLTQGLESKTAPSEAELRAMREIQGELEAQPYRQGRQDQEGVYTPGSPNAPVYQALQQKAAELADTVPGVAAAQRMSGGELQNGIAQTLKTGEWNAASRAAFEVARGRVNAAQGDAFARGSGMGRHLPTLGEYTTVGLPVDLRPVRTALDPIYRQLQQENRTVPFQDGTGKAKALRALTRLMESDAEQVPLSVADAALGEIKALARGADLPALRTEGQGIAAQAVKALDAQVRATAAKVGGLQALEEGRAATRGKFDVADVYDALRAEPGQLFKAVTAPKDSQVGLLKRVAEVAPEKMPDVARAWLEDRMSLATERGRFDHADRIYTDWRNMGTETKKVLFPDPAQRAALDHFFLLAKRLQENPNPSGTAHVNTIFNWFSTIGSYPTAKLLYTPRGVSALTRWMTRPQASEATIRSAGQTAGFVEVLAAAKAAGVPIQVPMAADKESRR